MNEYENNQQQWSQGQGYRQQRGSIFAILSVLLGVLSLLMILTGILPLFFGSLSIIFAVLSKGRSTRMDKSASLGFGISIFSMVVGLAFTLITVTRILNDPVLLNQLKSEYDRTFESVYGVDFDSYMQMMQDYYDNGSTLPAPKGGTEL